MGRILKIASLGVGFMLYVLAILSIGLISLPLLITQTNESNPNQVLIVHTNNYRLGESELYPIGALDWNRNNFRIENISNESINTSFLISLKNLSCLEYLNANVLIGSDSLEIFLAKNTVDEISIPIEVASHESLELTLLIPWEHCDFSSETPSFPVAIYEWEFLEK